MMKWSIHTYILAIASVWTPNNPKPIHPKSQRHRCDRGRAGTPAEPAHQPQYPCCRERGAGRRRPRPGQSQGAQGAFVCQSSDVEGFRL